MPSVDVTVQSALSQSVRAQQLQAMFDVPRAESVTLSWKGDLPIDEREWHVGLIVGPSGSGKSTILRGTFGETARLEWGKASVIDDFADSLSMNEIAEVCNAVGFNTIPAWLRPFEVLSNGEKFRVELARRLLEVDGTIVMDEFTSVVDRQVAKIGAHAVQKAVRRRGRQFVAASCHVDIIDWLQPDWTLEPATMTFQWRSVQRRPALEFTLRRVEISTWALFAPYHYMTAELHRGAQCWALFHNSEPVAFAGVLHRPHKARHDIKGISRGVTLPDWQGLGLMPVLISTLGAIYKAAGLEIRSYPAHPVWIRAHDKSPLWKLERKPGFHSVKSVSSHGVGSGRPCAVFSYCGPAATREEAEQAGLIDELSRAAAV